MRLLVLPLLAGVCLFTTLGFSGPRSTGGALYERLICVVPLVGSGTLDDPKRPMFAPVAGQPLTAEPPPSKGLADPPTILSYRSVPTDDGQRVIVEFAARDRSAFKQILENTDTSVQVFDPHKKAASVLLQQLRLLKKNFDLSVFGEGGL